MSGFSKRLQDHLKRLEDLRQRGASEASIRDSFLQFLRGAFPRLERSEPIELEKHIPAARVAGRSFADALYGELIFEFKRRIDDASRAEGEDELRRYIANQKHPQRFIGMLTDGQVLIVYALRDKLEKTDQIDLASSEPGEAQLWLDCYLFHEKNRIPTANDVALRFGDRGEVFRSSLWQIEQLWSRLESDPAVQTKFAEWQSLLSIVYGSRIGSDTLFLRHTYLALFARVLAFVVLERRAPDDDELPGLVFGEAFEQHGLYNVVGNDFFTWPSVDDGEADLHALLRSLATRLTVSYDLSAIHEDLLKELYQELVDPETRHDLGEFYTPDWLAELTLREARFPPRSTKPEAASLIDPSCGSGTFLFTAVRLMRESGLRGKALVDYAESNLAGIDIHPLAVTIAKTNLLLALGDDLKKARKGFTLPVYMANTLSVDVGATKRDPHRRAVEVPVDVDALAKQTGKAKSRSSGSFEIPLAVAVQPNVLHQLIDDLIAFGNPDLEAGDASAGLERRLNDLGVPQEQRDFWYRNLRLMRWLLAPPATNSVWRFVLQNAYQPELLAMRRFRFVVGNPPWLSYRYIERADYQQRVRELVFYYELQERRQAHLVTQMELATLFFALCADRFLAEGGTLAFVMPRSIMTGAKQHTAFAKAYLSKAKRILDCERVSPLFNVPTCSVIWRSQNTDEIRPPSIRAYSAVLPAKNLTLAQAESLLSKSSADYQSLNELEASPYLDELTQGASIVPRCLWFARPPEGARTVNVKKPYLETDPAIERQAKKPWKGLRVSGSVEAEFLYYTLLSDNMVPFGWRRLSLVVLPIEPDERNGMRLLDAKEAIRLGKTGLAEWLGRAEQLWKKYSKASKRVPTIYHRLDFSRCLTQQRPEGVVKLLYNTSGTHVCGSVTTDATTGPNVQAFPDHAGFVADTTTYWLETSSSAEAHYLCAFLNAPSVDKAIKPYQTKGAFGAQHGGGERHIHRRPFEVVSIPRYSSKDVQHRELARISEQCHRRIARWLESADEETLTTRIGRLRTLIRKDVLADELAEIDALARQIVDL